MTTSLPRLSLLASALTDEGTTTVTASCTDAVGSTMQTTFRVSVSLFPLGPEGLNPSIYKAGSFSTSTHGLTTGLEYENFFNAGNQKTNVAHENLVIGNIPAGVWTMVRGVDFGEKGASVLKARLRGRGQMEVRLDDISSDAVATIAFSSAGWKEPTVSLDPTLVKGKHDVYFYFAEGRAVMFDEWQFVENVSTAIQRPSWQNHGKAVPEMYDLNGRTLNGSLPQGVVIQRDPASGATRKVLVK